MLKKVIVFIPAIEKGGVERNAIWVANQMAEQGLEVDVLYVRAEEGQLEKLNSPVNKVRFERKSNKWVNQRIMDAISMRRNLKQYLEKQELKTTVLIAFQSASVAIGVCKKVGIKVICRLSNHPSAVKYEASLVRRISEWIKPFTYRKADAVIANSNKLAEDFGKKIHKEVITIYNPIDFESIDLAKREELEEPLIEEAKRYEGRLLVSVGRLSLQKDYETMLTGIAKSRYKDELMLWIVGDGNKRAELETLVQNLGIQGSVHFIGYTNNVYKYLQYADLFVQTSLYEGCPNALIEAVAVGIPAIAANCFSGPEEVLVQGKGGDLIPVRDSGALAERIDAFFDDKQELYKKSEIAKTQIVRFEGKNTLAAYLQLLNNVLEV